MRKTTIFTFTLLSSLAILPAIAQVNTGGLGQVWTDFQSYSRDLQTYFQNNLSDKLEPLERDFQNALLNSAKGELNITNPVLAGQKIRDQLILPRYSSDSRSNRFENNSAVRGTLVSNELNRVISRGVAESILGINGQIRTKAKLESTEQSLEDIAGITDDGEIQQKIQQIRSQQSAVTGGIAGLAEVLGLTQLQTTQIQREQVKIVAETFAQTLQTNQSLQYSNLNLANISQQSEEANRARRVETSTEAARLLQATSQLNLFGSQVNQ
ncbi:hypothetical protein [Nostoc sp. LPT]|uniref:hypothetical protein n=1 Tax=Nostoc sp. LPT TaxID=2815387 RepID=UPI001DFBD8DD|nr:hypothetical protein [Nostoc sp. LPT]MBN4005313.1 hypothetical protein [Nostoc sp. LPT]